MARINFNIAETRPYAASTYTVLPAGDYNVEIVSEKEVTLRDGQSRALVFEYQVLDGAYKGQRVRDTLNLWHVKEAAVNFSQSVLTAIAKACGRPVINDTQELQRIPFTVTVATRVYNDKEYNNFIDYKALQNRPTQQIPPQPLRELKESDLPNPAYWS